MSDNLDLDAIERAACGGDLPEWAAIDLTDLVAEVRRLRSLLDDAGVSR